jgi:hypothetical protein
MIGPAMDELLASLQLLRREAKAGRSVWHAFWTGAPEPRVSSASEMEDREAATSRDDTEPGRALPILARSVIFALGLWLMAAPALLHYGDLAGDNHRVVGPCVAALAIVALSQVTRVLRRINLLLGVWLIVSPIWFNSGTTAALVGVLSGCVVAALSFEPGPRPHSYGEGWRTLFRSWHAEGA